MTDVTSPAPAPRPGKARTALIAATAAVVLAGAVTGAVVLRSRSNADGPAGGTKTASEYYDATTPDGYKTTDTLPADGVLADANTRDAATIDGADVRVVTYPSSRAAGANDQTFGPICLGLVQGVLVASGGDVMGNAHSFERLDIPGTVAVALVDNGGEATVVDGYCVRTDTSVVVTTVAAAPTADGLDATRAKVRDMVTSMKVRGGMPALDEAPAPTTIDPAGGDSSPITIDDPQVPGGDF